MRGGASCLPSEKAASPHLLEEGETSRTLLRSACVNASLPRSTRKGKEEKGEARSLWNREESQPWLSFAAGGKKRKVMTAWSQGNVLFPQGEKKGD